jgi:hypothetical protein
MIDKPAVSTRCNELAGPRIYSYEELLRTIARSAELRPVLMRMPFAFWHAVAGLAEILPQPPLTRNQVELMQIDTTASSGYFDCGRAVGAFCCGASRSFARQ